MVRWCDKPAEAILPSNYRRMERCKLYPAVSAQNSLHMFICLQLMYI